MLVPSELGLVLLPWLSLPQRLGPDHLGIALAPAAPAVVASSQQIPVYGPRLDAADQPVAFAAVSARAVDASDR